MCAALPDQLTARHPTAEDHGRVLACLDLWWAGFGGPAGAQERALLLPRLFFQHFADTSYVVEGPDGRLAGFLIGFLSQSDHDTAYIHFVGVDPSLHGAGVGTWLYQQFFDAVARRGAGTVRCITSPGNTASIAFHTRLGFRADPADERIGDVPVQRNYDGPGLDRISFSRPLRARSDGGAEPQPDGGVG